MVHKLKKIIPLLLITCSSVGAQEMTLNQVLQRVIDHYPSVKRAAIQVEKAKQDIIKVESQLGWQFSAQAGVSQNVSFFGIASNTFDASGEYSKQLSSGSTLSIDASLTHDDADAVFSSTIPNPTTITSVNLNYRNPLKKGSDNPVFEEEKLSALTGVNLQQAEELRLYDQLASTVIELYLSAAITQARIDNLNAAVKRSQRLQRFIKNREKLGISEEKDTLQVNAQLRSQQADLSGLKITWEKQRLSLNRLMGLSVTSSFQPTIEKIQVNNFDSAYRLAVKHSPEIKTADARIKLADSAIRLRRNDNEDQLDLVLFIGARNQSGDTGAGSSNESDIVGGARLEFLQQQDKSGLDAQLYQAQLDRSAAIEDKRQVIEDLQYDIASLQAEIKAATQALRDYQKSVDSEKLKLKEAEQRYKTGRADTDQIIQFENELSLARLSFELQRIELSRRLLNLQLKQGLTWESIQIYEGDNYLKRYEQ